MIVYLAGFLASALIAYMGLHNPKASKHRKLLIFFSALPLILIAAFRYDVGEDYLLAYVPYFYTVLNGVDTAAIRMEPLYHLINEIVCWLGGDYEWVFVITALLFLLLVYNRVFEDSPQPVLSIYLLIAMGYYFVFFNAMRQMVGCAFLLLAMRYIERKKLLSFLLCVVVAMCFHYSCVVFVVMYWLGRMNIKPVVALFLTGIVFAVKGILSQFLRMLVALTQYEVYLSSIFDTGQTAYVFIAINLVLLIFASVFYQDNHKYRMYYNAHIVAVWITIFSGDIVLVLRLLWAFGLPSIILLPMACEGVAKKRDCKMIVAVMVLLYAVYTIYTVGIQNSNSVLPYQTIFSRW